MDASSLLRQGLSLPQSSPPSPPSAPSAQPPALPRARSPTAAPARFAAPRICPPASASSALAHRSLLPLARPPAAAAHRARTREREMRAAGSGHRRAGGGGGVACGLFDFSLPLFPGWGGEHGRRRLRLLRGVRFACSHASLRLASFQVAPTVRVSPRRGAPSTDRCDTRDPAAGGGDWRVGPVSNTWTLLSIAVPDR